MDERNKKYIQSSEMYKKLVSVGIPAYKASYLKEAIDSVLNQTYTNFELIIVNDNSPEDIDSIVSVYNDSRIRYYKNERNLGKESIVLNWNKCLSYARGEFFVLLCDDDKLEPTFIEKMYSLTLKYPQCNVFKSRTKLINSINNTVIGESPIWPEYETYEDFFINKIKGCRKHTISEFLYRTKYIRKCNGYKIYPVGFYADDHSILEFSKENGIATSNECLIIIRKSEEHISTNTIYNIGKVKAALIYYDWIKKTHNLNDEEIKRVNGCEEYEIYNYFINSKNLRDAIYILCIIPNNVFNLKNKLKCLINRIL